jgi:GT2 family glycosyltransferase
VSAPERREPPSRAESRAPGTAESRAPGTAVTQPQVSVVIETWNIGSDPALLAVQLDKLALQVAELATDVVITHAGIAANVRDELATKLALPVRWVELAINAGYYEHKNSGFDATRGDVIAFIDGDCAPSAGWLEALLAPFSDGAQVVAGATSYAGALAPLANELDFPYFDGAEPRRRFAATSRASSPTVRNFFANNVAFTRDAFAARRYPTITPMFHGQCQVLALRLLEDGIPIVYAPDARVTHAWPDSVTEWLQVRLLRGADTTQLLPHVVGTYAPAAREPVTRLGPLPALAVLGMRAVTATLSALRRGPTLRGLALVAGVTAVDALGAAAAPAVYRYVAP